MRFSVATVDSIENLSPFVAEWRELAENAVEPNCFYGPDFLLPAMQSLGGKNVRIALVFAEDGRHRRLRGLFPLKARVRFHWLPLSILTTWQHLHCFLCVPLLHREDAPDSLDAFLDWVAKDPSGAALMEFRFLSTNGPFYRVLDDRLAARGWATRRSLRRERALLVRQPGDGGDYIRDSLSGDRRRTLARKERRLAERGPVTYEQLQNEAELEPWIADFLRLEGGGWKGRAGSALSCHEAESEFFATTVREAFFGRSLLFVRILSAGTPIAYRISFLTGEGAFAFKAAFDEAYAYFSPGALLEIETIRRLHLAPQVRWMDSCTEAGHSLLDSFWRDRRQIETITVASRHLPGSWALHALRWAERLRRRAPAIPIKENPS